jgi:hypothetical protein
MRSQNDRRTARPGQAFTVMGRWRLLSSPELSSVPIAGYFQVVGSALADLLWLAGWTLPELPGTSSNRPDVIDRAIIRIESARKWPERIIFDANQPTFSPPSAEANSVQELAGSPPDEEVSRASVVSFASFVAKPKPEARAVVANRPLMRDKHKKARSALSAHVARVRHRNEPQEPDKMCCWFGSAAQTTSRAISRKRIARRDPWTGLLDHE